MKLRLHTHKYTEPNVDAPGKAESGGKVALKINYLYSCSAFRQHSTYAARFLIRMNVTIELFFFIRSHINSKDSKR